MAGGGFNSAGQPSRPYSSPEMTGGNAGRTAEANKGLFGDPDSAAGVSSEIADSARYNAMVPRQFSQHSVLQTAMPSSNGMSMADYQQRMLPGGSMLPTANGSSEDTYQRSLVMRLQGREF